jgi:hypothetical protein
MNECDRWCEKVGSHIHQKIFWSVITIAEENKFSAPKIAFVINNFDVASNMFVSTSNHESIIPATIYLTLIMIEFPRSGF